MKQDRGELARKWSGVGNTLLFAAILLLILYKITMGDYQFAMAVALAGLYAEAWNFRVSEQREREEDDD